MDKKDIEKIRLVQLEIMDIIHNICEENNFTYYLMSGSVLGAIRHKGFIPWDVDIDIGMPRDDYDKFKAYCLNNDIGPYTYYDHTVTRDYIPPHALVCKNGTSLTTRYSKYNTLQREHGIFVDVIPLDNAPAQAADLRRLEKKYERVQSLKERKINYRYRPFWAQPIKHGVKLLLKWALFGISLKRINIIEDSVMRTYNGAETEHWVAMGAGYRFDKEYMPKRIYGTPQLAEFEGRKYYIPECADEYLKLMYGDYMTLPPLEVREAGCNYYESVSFTEE